MLLSRIDILEEIKGMYKVLCKDGRAKRARLETVHGTVETPVFMNVGTIGAIKGAVSTRDLEEIETQIMLCNTYHLHVRPGDDVVYVYNIIILSYNKL